MTTFSHEPLFFNGLSHITIQGYSKIKFAIFLRIKPGFDVYLPFFTANTADVARLKSIVV